MYIRKNMGFIFIFKRPKQNRVILGKTFCDVSENVGKKILFGMTLNKFL